MPAATTKPAVLGTTARLSLREPPNVDAALPYPCAVSRRIAVDASAPILVTAADQREDVFGQIFQIGGNPQARRISRHSLASACFTTKRHCIPKPTKTEKPDIECFREPANSTRLAESVPKSRAFPGHEPALSTYREAGAHKTCRTGPTRCRRLPRPRSAGRRATVWRPPAGTAPWRNNWPGSVEYDGDKAGDACEKAGN